MCHVSVLNLIFVINLIHIIHHIPHHHFNASSKQLVIHHVWFQKFGVGKNFPRLTFEYVFKCNFFNGKSDFISNRLPCHIINSNRLIWCSRNNSQYYQCRRLKYFLCKPWCIVWFRILWCMEKKIVAMLKLHLIDLLDPCLLNKSINCFIKKTCWPQTHR